MKQEYISLCHKLLFIGALMCMMSTMTSGDWISPSDYEYYYGGGDIYNTFDGIPSTKWVDTFPKTDRYVEYNLGKDYNISNYRIYGEYDGGEGQVCKIGEFKQCNLSADGWLGAECNQRLVEFTYPISDEGDAKWTTGNKTGIYTNRYVVGQYVYLYGIDTIKKKAGTCTYIESNMTGFNEVQFEVFNVNGGTCTIDANCSEGHCVGGTCCDTACDTLCKSCLEENTGVSDGTCADRLDCCGFVADGDWVYDADAECIFDTAVVKTSGNIYINGTSNTTLIFKNDFTIAPSSQIEVLKGMIGFEDNAKLRVEP